MDFDGEDPVSTHRHLLYCEIHLCAVKYRHSTITSWLLSRGQGFLIVDSLTAGRVGSEHFFYFL